MPRKGTHKGARRASSANTSRDLVFKSSAGQAYAVVVTMLGNRRVMARCDDGVERLCKIRGSIKRSEWISANDVVLVALRDFEDEKGDVLMRYGHDEVRQLRKIGELAHLLKWLDAHQADANHEDDDQTDVVFEDDDDTSWLERV